MPPLNINSLGQPLPDYEIRRNKILYEVNMVFGLTTSLERQVATLQDRNGNMGRELVHSNVRTTEIKLKLDKLNDELELHKSTITHLEDRIGAFVRIVAQAEGQIGVLHQTNHQLQGQLDRLHQLNRQLAQQYGQVTGLLNASMAQHQEAVDQVTVLRTQNQLLENLVDSNPTVTPHHIDTMMHAVNDFVTNGPGAATRPKVVEVDEQQPEGPTLTQDRVLTPFPNGTASPNDTALPMSHHEVTTKAVTSATEVKAKSASRSRIVATTLPKITMIDIVRGGKDVDDSFQRFLRNQNAKPIALDVNGNATLIPERKLNPESVPFTPSASVTPPSGTLNPLSEPFIPAGRIQPSGPLASFPMIKSEGKKPLDSSESLVLSEAKDEPTKFINSHTSPKLDIPEIEPINPSTSSNNLSITAMINKETPLLSHKRSPTAGKVERVPSANEKSTIRDAAVPTVKPVTLFMTSDESKLPPHKRIFLSSAKQETGGTSDKSDPDVTVDTSTQDGSPSNIPIKGETSTSVSGTDAATKNWLDSFDDQTTLQSTNDHGTSIAAEGESLISLPSSPQVENAKVVPLPPGYIPVRAPDATTVSATPTMPTDTSEAYAVPKNEKTLASDYMEAAKKRMSSFTTRYGSNPEAETRKELAEMGQALRTKLATEESRGINVIEYLGMKNVPRKIMGTHVLGELLDKSSKAHVLMQDSRGDWERPVLNWKPVEKNGKVCYVL